MWQPGAQYEMEKSIWLTGCTSTRPEVVVVVVAAAAVVIIVVVDIIIMQ
jgi:preprotein translocase subunit SecE